MYRIGIIGCGGIANTHGRVLWALSDRVTVTALCDIDGKRAADFNAKFAGGRAKVYTDFTEMFHESEMDIVYICLPPFAHANEVDMAAERGIHIFMEKPIALTMKQGDAMVEVTERHGVKTQVGFMSRFGGAVGKIKSMIDDGSAGAPGLMTGSYWCNALHAPWWREKEKCGGQIVEQIIHTFDILRYLLGEPETVYSRMDNIFHRNVERYTVEDVSATIVTFENGAIAAVTGTNGAIPGKWIGSYELVAGNITVRFRDANNATLFRTRTDPVSEETIEGGIDIMTAETLDFLKAVETGRDTRTPMSEGAATLRLVLAADESARTGKVVTL